MPSIEKYDKERNHCHNACCYAAEVWYEPHRMFWFIPVKRIKCLVCGEMIK